MSIHEGHRERLRSRFLEQGLDGFEDHNVLELLLFYALPRRDTNALAHELMNAFGSLSAVFDASPEALTRVSGVGQNAAALIRLVPEIARRYMIDRTEPGAILFDSASCGRFLVPYFTNLRQEAFYLVCLDAKLKVLDCRELARGGTVSAHVSPRLVVQTALERNASAAVIAHNHTSGIALPSQEDVDTTLRIRDALAMVGVTLVDHIVVAGGDFVSLADDGVLS